MQHTNTDLIVVAEELRGLAQNDYMIDGAFLPSGCLLVAMATLVSDAAAELARLHRAEGAARAFLAKLADMTSQDFSHGEERAEREALRSALEG